MQKSKKIIFTLSSILFLFSSCSETDWTVEKENEMIAICIKSSDYLSRIDSIDAWNIGGCIIDNIKIDNSYKTLINLREENVTKLNDIFNASFQNCTLPNLESGKRIAVFTKEWFPTKEEQIKIEDILIASIRKEQSEYWSVLNERTVKNYFRQYSFSFSKKGDKIVYINAFCQVLELPIASEEGISFQKQDWKKQTIMVSDGGDCYWQIEINMTKGVCDYFYVNGCA